MPRILVAGDYMLDHYYWGRCERISPEAPVPIVEVERESCTLGGAGNVVKNLLALGAEVSALGLRGKDDAGQQMADLLAQKGVDHGWLVATEGRPTTVKSRLIAGQQQVLRFDRESRAPLPAEVAEELLQHLESAWSSLDALIISDYAKGCMTLDFTPRLIQQARAHRIPVFVDPKGQDYRKYRGATLITPNRKEAQQATGLVLDQPESLALAAQQLQQNLALDCVVITLSEDGIGIYDGAWQQVPTTAREVFDVTGAGDTSLAALVIGWLEGLSLFQCARLANAAAAVVIAKLGSETASRAEIEAYLS